MKLAKSDGVYLNPALKAGHSSQAVGRFKVFVYNMMLKRNVKDERAVEIANRTQFALQMLKGGGVRVGMGV